jgi:HlyD family secretion protein
MPTENSKSLNRNLRTGLLLAVSFVAFAAITTTAAELAGAVIAQGQLVVESNVKKVQHPTGGVVGQILVREGDRVRAGDVVLRLDEVQTRANLAIVIKALDELKARRAREEAERDGDQVVQFPDDLMARATQPAVVKVLNGELKLFENRRTAREGLKAQLEQRKAQTLEEVAGLMSQISGKENESRWIRDELVGVRELWSKKLVQITRVTALERDSARLEGDRGSLISSIAQARGKLTETQLQIIQIDQDMRTEVGKDLSEIRGKISEYEERQVAAEDQLKRIELRAPQDGVVHQLDVHTVGGVVTPGQPIMLIVPDSDALRVEARVQPQDIDQLHVGQIVVLRFSSFNQRVTPELNGKVAFISPDVAIDQKTGAPYYVVRAVLVDGELARLNGLVPVAGMPVEAFFATKTRTIASYLLRPFSDQLHRSFRGR